MIGSVNQLAAYWTNLHGRPRCTYEAFDWHQRSRDAQSIPYDAGGSRWRTGRHDPDCRVEHHAFGTIVRSKRFAHRRDRDQIGRAHVCPVTNAHLVCRLLLEKKKISTTVN